MKRSPNFRYDLTRAAKRAQEFADERDWEQYHSPKNLVMAIVGEIGELSSLLQWKSDDEITQMLVNDEDRRQIEEEVADVAIYLIRFSQIAGIELAQVIDEKFRANERKYPVHISKGSAEKYRNLDHE
ncbi:MAG TPA: nucleotide pyrophosphohydrolase [Acidimicrobiales bacterium]